jgi:hypothetical protein
MGFAANASTLGMAAALLVATLGLPLLILPDLSAVLVGMMLVGVGTFFAQACATGFVGRRQPPIAARQAGCILPATFSAA